METWNIPPYPHVVPAGAYGAVPMLPRFQPMQKAKLPHRRQRLAPKHIRSTKSILRKVHKMRYTSARSFPSSLFIPSLTPVVDLTSQVESTPQPFRPLPTKISRRSPSPRSVLSVNESKAASHDTIPPSTPVPPCVVSPEAQSTPRVHFHQFVRLKQIPSRSAYPREMKNNLWSSAQEISANVKRNTIEFAADDWDWRSATEEDGMFWHRSFEEYIHPVHVLRHEQKRARKYMSDRRRRKSRSPTSSIEK